MSYDPYPSNETATAIHKDGSEEKIMLVKDEEFSDIVWFHFYSKGKRIDSYEEAAEAGITSIRIESKINIHL